MRFENTSAQGVSGEAGFSLIEILVTLALVALITAMVIPNTTSIFRTNLDSYARRAANIFREARDYAILMNRVVRVQIDLDKQEYWVEDAPANFLMPNKTDTAPEDISDEEKKKEKKRQEQFRLSKDVLKDKQKVPNGIKIAAVISPRSKTVLTEGIASVYYFPHGVGEAAVVHLEDIESDKRSLVLHPVTGKTKLQSGFYFPSEEHKK